MNIPGDSQPIRELRRFQSRRNAVKLVQTEQGYAVLKAYGDAGARAHEQWVYRLLQGSALPHARISGVLPDQLLLTVLPGRVLTELLEEQELTGAVDWRIWNELVRWLIGFHHSTGLVMTDVNLRNFLYDPETQTLYGLDFEECAEGTLLRTAGLLAAYIRNYAPEHTPLKEKIAEYVLREFSRCLEIPVEELLAEAQKQEIFLQNRRKAKKDAHFPAPGEDRRRAAETGRARQCVKEKP